MWVTAKQGFDKYAIYNTVTDVFEGVNLSKEACETLRRDRYRNKNAEIDDESLMSLTELCKQYIDED